MICPDCHSMTTVTKTDRFTPDAPTRRLRACDCGFRGVSREDWERRLGIGPGIGSGANRQATGEPVRGTIGGSGSDLPPDLNPISPGNPKRGRARSNRDAETEAFAAFYAEFPRKKKRPRAFRAWVAQGCEAIADLVMAGLRRQLPELKSRELDKVPYPSSWLNDREWEDQPQSLAPVKFDPRCPFHRQAFTQNKKAHIFVGSCPECKHVAARNGKRQAEPTSFDWAKAPTADELAALRKAGGNG